VEASEDIMTEAKNNCGMKELLVSYLYGEASPDEVGTVQKHLSECGVCAGELESFERVRGMLQQWQFDELPVVRVAVEPPPRSFLTVLKELFKVAPLWAKAGGALATTALVFAVMGTDIRVGNGGVSFHADLLRRDSQQRSTSEADLERLRAEVRTVVNQTIDATPTQANDELKARLVSLESQLQTMQTTELAKLASRIQEQQTKIRTLERDFDRREGLDLTDILFSEVTTAPGSETPEKGGE
jgi:hypothetical protein